jgi:dTDP-glucose pyrophosphorylase
LEATYSIGKSASIPAAGFKTRMLPGPKSVPKELPPIVDRSITDYIVAEAFACGIEQVVIITERKSVRFRTSQPEVRSVGLVGGQPAGGPDRPLQEGYLVA